MRTCNYNSSVARGVCAHWRDPVLLLRGNVINTLLKNKGTEAWGPLPGAVCVSSLCRMHWPWIEGSVEWRKQSCVPGQISLIQVSIYKLQKSLGLMVGIHNRFCLKRMSGERLQARRTEVLQGTKELREKETSKWNKRGVQSHSPFGQRLKMPFITHTLFVHRTLCWSMGGKHWQWCPGFPFWLTQ